MERAWAARRPVAVRAIFEGLTGQIAYTTVMTVLDKPHRKGWLMHEMVDRAYAYAPVRSRRTTAPT